MTDEEIKHHIEEFGWDFFEIANHALIADAADKYEAASIYAKTGARLCGAINGIDPFEEGENPEFDLAKDGFIIGWDCALDRLGHLLGLPADALRAAVDMTDEFNLSAIPDGAIAELRALGPFVQGQSDPKAYYDKMGEILGIAANTRHPEFAQGWTERGR